MFNYINRLCPTFQLCSLKKSPLLPHPLQYFPHHLFILLRDPCGLNNLDVFPELEEPGVEDGADGGLDVGDDVVRAVAMDGSGCAEAIHKWVYQVIG